MQNSLVQNTTQDTSIQNIQDQPLNIENQQEQEQINQIDEQLVFDQSQFELEENYQEQLQQIEQFEQFQQIEQFESDLIKCPFCDEEMLQEYYQNHINLCQQQIGNYNLIEQQCQQCGETIIKLYQNDHLEICPGNFWIEVKCPYCSSSIIKAHLKDHITQCNVYVEQQQREIKGIKNCSICLEDILENRANLKCFHSFHQDCIENWLKQRQRCPICKRITDKALIQ